MGRQAPRTDIEKLKRIRGALARRRVLLFLDNPESAQDFDDILTYLSQIAPPATVLLTSRRYIPGRLGHNIPLYELGLEEGIALFEQIGARYERRLESAEEKTMVEIICGDLLQGHPGAIEIAAALWRSWPLREILRGLHTRAMETLVDRERTDVNRSMRLSIGLSYDLLARESPEAWTLFPRLSVFSASFTAQATEQVCEVTNSLPSLDFLVNRSLVRFDRRRYHLHAVVREYGLEKLGEDREYFERRAAFYFLDYALGHSEDLDALEEERGNLFATIEWYEHKEPALVPQLVGLLHTFMDRRGYWEERLRRTRKALQIAELLEDAEEMAHLCFVMGSTHRNRGELEEARAYFERGLAIGLRIADDRAVGTGHHLLATMAYDQDDLDEARTFALEAVRVFERAQLKDLLPFVYSLLVSIERRSGNLQEAYRYAEKELGLARDMDDPDQRDIALQDLVEIALDARDYARAEHHIEEYRTLVEETKAPQKQGRLSLLLATLAFEQENWAEARAHFLAALPLFERHGSPTEVVVILEGLAEVGQHEGDLPSAEGYLRRYVDIMVDLGNLQKATSGLKRLGVIQEQQGRFQEAKRAYQEAVQLCEGAGLEADPEIEEALSRLDALESGYMSGDSLPPGI